MRQHNFVLRMPEVAAAQVLTSCFARAIWRQPRTWPRRTTSPSARPGCTWPREIPPQRWRCWSHSAGRWRSGPGRMNGSRSSSSRRRLRCAWRAGRGRAAARRSAGAGRAGRLHPPLRRRRRADGSPAPRGAVSRGSSGVRAAAAGGVPRPTSGARAASAATTTGVAGESPGRTAQRAASSRCSPSSPKG